MDALLVDDLHNMQQWLRMLQLRYVSDHYSICRMSVQRHEPQEQHHAKLNVGRHTRCSLKARELMSTQVFGEEYKGSTEPPHTFDFAKALDHNIYGGGCATGIEPRTVLDSHAGGAPCAILPGWPVGSAR